MTEPSNAVLAEQMRQMERNFIEFKNETREVIKDLEKDVEQTRRIADEVNTSTRYVKEAVGKMESMMTNFINVVNTQNAKIDDFINSDSRRTSKNNLVVSVLQVTAGIVVAALGFWAKGNL